MFKIVTIKESSREDIRINAKSERSRRFTKMAVVKVTAFQFNIKPHEHHQISSLRINQQHHLSIPIRTAALKK